MNRLNTGRRQGQRLRPPKYSKAIVALVIALNAAFAAAVLWIFTKTSVEPTTLTVAWFGFTTGELWALAMLKRCETKKEEGKKRED